MQSVANLEEVQLEFDKKSEDPEEVAVHQNEEAKAQVQVEESKGQEQDPDVVTVVDQQQRTRLPNDIVPDDSSLPSSVLLGLADNAIGGIQPGSQESSGPSLEVINQLSQQEQMERIQELQAQIEEVKQKQRQTEEQMKQFQNTDEYKKQNQKANLINMLIKMGPQRFKLIRETIEKQEQETQWLNKCKSCVAVGEVD